MVTKKKKRKKRDNNYGVYFQPFFIKEIARELLGPFQNKNRIATQYQRRYQNIH